MHALTETYTRKIEEINILINRFIDVDHEAEDYIKLFSGLPGAALFLYQYAQFRPEKEDEYHQKIASIIENAFEYISKTPNPAASFCNGIAGTLWVTEYMRKKGIVDMDDDYLDPALVEYLRRESVTQTLALNHCDLLHGGFGFWAFLLECNNFPGKEQLIQQQLQVLNKITFDTPNGRNWKINDMYFKGGENGITPDPVTSVNLGLAHGISAILVLLAKTRLNGYFEDRTEENIHKGLQLIRSLKIADPASASLYPSIVINGEIMGGTRLAWCYGDFCVANAFWMAWEATGCEEYKNEALSIVDFLCRKDFRNSGVKDAGLCHGSAGVAQIFRCFHQRTGNPMYKEAADKWLAFTLGMATHPDGYAGYKTYRSSEDSNFVADYSFLTGITGIGLVLLSYFSDKPADWDRALQLG